MQNLKYLFQQFFSHYSGTIFNYIFLRKKYNKKILQALYSLLGYRLAFTQEESKRRRKKRTKSTQVLWYFWRGIHAVLSQRYRMCSMKSSLTLELCVEDEDMFESKKCQRLFNSFVSLCFIESTVIEWTPSECEEKNNNNKKNLSHKTF